MIGEAVPLVLIPRFSSYVGANEFTTAPLRVSDYSKANVTFWRSPLLGTGTTTVSVKYQESHDADSWSDLGTEITTGGSGQTGSADNQTLTLKKRWLRVRVALTVSGGSAGLVAITCWATGQLERRIAD